MGFELKKLEFFQVLLIKGFFVILKSIYFLIPMNLLIEYIHIFKIKHSLYQNKS